MRCFGWLMLMPLVGAFALVIYAASACGKKGGIWRLLGVLLSLVIGGICILVGYSIGIEGYIEGTKIVTYPVLGWLSMIGGGLMAILGIWTAVMTEQEYYNRFRKY